MEEIRLSNGKSETVVPLSLPSYHNILDQAIALVEWTVCTNKTQDSGRKRRDALCVYSNDASSGWMFVVPLDPEQQGSHREGDAIADLLGMCQKQGSFG